MWKLLLQQDCQTTWEESCSVQQCFKRNTKRGRGRLQPCSLVSTGSLSSPFQASGKGTRRENIIRKEAKNTLPKQTTRRVSRQHLPNQEVPTKKAHFRDGKRARWNRDHRLLCKAHEQTHHPSTASSRFGQWTLRNKQEKCVSQSQMMWVKWAGHSWSINNVRGCKRRKMSDVR